MKKIILLCLAAMPLCQAADHHSFYKFDPYENWNDAVQGIDLEEKAAVLNLSNKNIMAIPNDFNFRNLGELNLDDNQLTALPETLGRSKIGFLYLSNNQINDKEVDKMIQQIENRHYYYLSQLDLSGNPITRDAVSRLKKALRSSGSDFNMRAHLLSENIIGDSMNITR